MSIPLVNQLPDSLRLCDSEVKEGWAGCLHAGIPGWRHPTFPLERSPALRQEVHQQGRGVEGEKHLSGTFLCWQVAQSWEEIPEGREEDGKGRRERKEVLSGDCRINGIMFFWYQHARFPLICIVMFTWELLCPSTLPSPPWPTSRPSSQRGPALGSQPASGSGSSRSRTATVQSLPPSDRKSPRPAMSTESGMWRK